MATAAQIEANRRNAQKSTGPKTPEGKERSRRNALKHGLAAREMLPEHDEATLARRTERLGEALRPADAWQEELVGRIAADTLRAERCGLEESAFRSLAARRAELCWDDDRALDAEVLGKALARRPAETKPLLERTPQGCAWLAARWGDLIRLLGTDAFPEVDRRAMAGDLLGLPAERQVGAGPLGRTDAGLADLARAEIDRLEARRAMLAELDGAERDLAESGLGPEVEKAVRRVRRYESACLRRVQWAIRELGKLRDGLAPDPTPRGGSRDDRGGPPVPAVGRPESGRAPAPPSPSASHPTPARTEPISTQPLGISIVPTPIAPHRPTLAGSLATPGPNRRGRRAARRAC